MENIHHLIALSPTICLVLSLVSFSMFGLYFLWLFATQITALLLDRKIRKSIAESIPAAESMPVAESIPAAEPMIAAESMPAAAASRFAVLICASNEEDVIARLIQSVYAQDYDRDLFDIFVVAHNCSDATSRVAEESGARVFVHNTPDRRKKAEALSHGIRQIRQLPIHYDAFAFFDADNIADPAFLRCADQALRDGADMVQGKYASCNYHESIVSELSGALWLQTFHTQSEAFTHVGLPVLAYGTGFVLRTSAIPREGWPTVTLVEDFEMSILLALSDRHMVGNGNMKIYAQQPVRLKDALEQRKRWAVGDMQCLRHYFFPVIRSIPKKGIKAVKILVDLLINVALVGFSSGMVFLLAYAVLYGLSIQSFLILLGTLIGTYWLGMAAASLIMFHKEGMYVRDNLATLVLFPFWILLSAVLACYALFVKDLEWRT